MDLDYRQMRRLYLAGTVAFPMPFPTVGSISIEEGKLARSPQGSMENKLLVLVREELTPEHARTHIILAEWVSAIFYFTAKDNRVDDFENGKWELGPPANADKVSGGKAKASGTRRETGRRGIVFVQEHRPVLTLDEVAQTAGSVGARPVGYVQGCDR
jgi:hypothetical protein